MNSFKGMIHHLTVQWDHWHTILGFFAFFLHFIPYTYGTAGMTFGLMFVGYEGLQAWQKKDTAWPAIKGYMFGYFLAGLLTLITVGLVKILGLIFNWRE